MDLSKFSDEQLQIASKIITTAKAEGVDPNLALALAFAENRFRAEGKSAKGAIGPMQLMPATAEALGVDPYNVEENILGGVRYIKQLSGMSQIGANPINIAVAYNAGPNSKFFETGDPRDIPDETIQYVNSANTVSGGLIAPAAPAGEAPATESLPPESEELPAPATTQPTGFSVGQDLMAGATGAGIGAAAGTAQKVGRGVSALGETVRDIRQAATTAANAAAGAPGPRPSNLPPPGGPVVRTPVGGQATANYAKQFGLTDFDAARALDMSKSPGGAWDVARQVREAESKIGPGWRMTPERADLLLPDTVGSGPRGQARAPIPPVPEPPGPGPLQRMAGAAARSPVMTGALGGFGAGAGMAEATERYRRDDIPGAVTSGVGALGSLLSMYPPTAPVGIPMSVAGPLATMGVDAYRRAAAQGPGAPATEEELRMARTPALGIHPRIARRRGDSPTDIARSLMDSLRQQESEFRAATPGTSSGSPAAPAGQPLQ